MLLVRQRKDEKTEREMNFGTITRREKYQIRFVGILPTASCIKICYIVGLENGDNLCYTKK